MSEPADPQSTPAADPQDPAREPEPTDWKAEARKWEQRAKENTAKLRELEPKAAEYDGLVEASKSDLEKANEQVARWQADAQTWRKAAVGSRIEALAATEFADPTDAVASLSEGNYLDAGGQIDDAAIKRDLAGLLDKKPHWRRQSDTSPRRLPAPNGAQGSGGAAPPADPATQFASILQGQLGSR